jgi:hypothetical protein
MKSIERNGSPVKQMGTPYKDPYASMPQAGVSTGLQRKGSQLANVGMRTLEKSSSIGPDNRGLSNSLPMAHMTPPPMQMAQEMAGQRIPPSMAQQMR